MPKFFSRRDAGRRTAALSADALVPSPVPLYGSSAQLISNMSAEAPGQQSRPPFGSIQQQVHGTRAVAA
jgi:hypothetical protein